MIRNVKMKRPPIKKVGVQLSVWYATSFSEQARLHRAGIAMCAWSSTAPRRAGRLFVVRPHCAVVCNDERGLFLEDTDIEHGDYGTDSNVAYGGIKQQWR
jgi:hypothetical protein